MARSPYAAPRRKPRWPWFAGALAVLALLSFAGIAASTGPFTDSDAARQQLAHLQATETPEPTATVAPTEPVADEPTEVADDPDAPLRTADAWFANWQRNDFAGMYRLTSSTTRTVISEAEFVERYNAIHNEAGIRSVSGEITGDPSDEGTYPYEVAIQSSLIGDYAQAHELSLVEEDGEWRVAWSPSLIFNQLDATGCVTWKGEPVRRGRILDASGDVLAEDAEVSQVGVVPGKLVEGDGTIDRLSEIIDMDPDDIRTIYQRDGINPDWFIPLKNLPSSQAVDLINQVTGMSGVQVQRAFARVYPEGPLFAHVTGFVTPATGEDVEDDESGAVRPGEMVGRAGLEYGANELLSGRPGGQLLVVECETRAERAMISEVEGVAPLDVTITIEIDFQREVDTAMADVDRLASVPSEPDPTAEVDERPRQERGAAVVIDPRSGAVLAMVSHPTYDPNNFVTGSFSDEELERINDATLAPQTNRAASATYPAGSIFKVITTAAAMANLDYTGETPINCPASFSIGSQTWNDWVVENGLSAQGELTLHSGLVQSCNTVFYQIGADLDNEGDSLLPDMARAFGLGSPTGLEYFPEATGVVPDPEWKQRNVNDGWATGDNVNLSIGQGYLLVSPLQMANAYAAIANGGELLQPYIVDRAQVSGTDQVQQVGERKVVRELPLTAEQVREIQSALRDQTSNDNGVGSSRIFNDFGWPISGKTGTAQNGPQDGSTKPHSWFAAYGPADDEASIASIVMFEQVGEGVQFAAPVTRAIYEDYVDSSLAVARP
jgi:penicillin-binding protein 2